MEDLKLDIKNLKKSYEKINEALNLLKDVEDFSEENFGNLSDIEEIISDLLIDKENLLDWRKENGI